MNSILITGGAGFIGSNFIKLLLKSTQYKVVNYDMLTYSGNLENLKGLYDYPNYHFELGDICDEKKVSEVIEQYEIDTIINFAAESHVDRSIIDAEPFLHTNILGVANLLNLTNKYNLEKFLQISTDEVYGSAPFDETFTEESNLNPNSPYSASKASADLLVRAYQQTFNTPALITRTTNNFGPYQYPEKFIPLIIVNAFEDKKIPVYGDGLNIRDWIYVEDNCRALLSVLEKGKIGEIYNISAKNEMTNLEIVKMILNLIGKSENLIEFVKDRPGHDKRYSISSNKIRENLLWQPQFAFEDALKNTFVWYRTHISWLNNIIKRSNFSEFYSTQYKTI